MTRLLSSDNILHTLSPLKLNKTSILTLRVTDPKEFSVDHELLPRPTRLRLQPLAYASLFDTALPVLSFASAMQGGRS